MLAHDVSAQDTARREQTEQNSQARRGMVFLVALALATASGSAPVALVTGALVGLTIRHPYVEQARALSKTLLQLCVVGLGFGMDLTQVVAAGRSSFGWTATGIALTLLLGVWLGRCFGVRPATRLLISAGTAICGGSAIVAIGPTAGAKEEDMSVALGTVFTLNATALLIFPWLGTQLGLSAEQFGMWAALAIHDTSSVVGAAKAFGPEALTIGTTVKLVRALWIVPLTLGVAWAKRSTVAMKWPWFILFFCFAVLLNTHFELGRPMFARLSELAHLGLSVALFAIGSGVSKTCLRGVGARAMLQAVVLWYLVAMGTLGAVRAGFVTL
jgi:uncharacterized integral membrane protein (TIGR00698 family)